MQQLTRIVTKASVVTFPTKQKRDTYSDVFGSSAETETGW